MEDEIPQGRTLFTKEQIADTPVPVLKTRAQLNEFVAAWSSVRSNRKYHLVYSKIGNTVRLGRTEAPAVKFSVAVIERMPPIKALAQLQGDATGIFIDVAYRSISTADKLGNRHYFVLWVEEVKMTCAQVIEHLQTTSGYKMSFGFKQRSDHPDFFNVYKIGQSHMTMQTHPHFVKKEDMQHYAVMTRAEYGKVEQRLSHIRITLEHIGHDTVFFGGKLHQ